MILKSNEERPNEEELECTEFRQPTRRGQSLQTSARRSDRGLGLDRLHCASLLRLCKLDPVAHKTTDQLVHKLRGLASFY